MASSALRSFTCAAAAAHRPLLPTARLLPHPPLARPPAMGPALSLLRLGVPGRGLRPVDARAAAADAAAGDAWLVVGLGNPGAKYAGTRHNIGFDAVDALAAAAGTTVDRSQCKAAVGRALLGGARVILAKPQTFMNLSGDSVAALAAFYKVPPSRCVVIYDDMDTPLGTVRLRSKGGAGGHNGIKSILGRMGASADFVRVRVGVGRPPPHITVVDWVLTRFDAGERDAAAQGVDAAVDAARSVVELGLQKALSGCRVVAGGGGPVPKAPKKEGVAGAA